MDCGLETSGEMCIELINIVIIIVSFISVKQFAYKINASIKTLIQQNA